jgi:hypothetical protein
MILLNSPKKQALTIRDGMIIQMIMLIIKIIFLALIALTINLQIAKYVKVYRILKMIAQL